ncbi:hypothetical protein FQA39_LY10565 [Lamprigera yunnana]|nr:hypothetical protein FQA39_LY10565 [Lamprigera yunnana]
MLRVYTFMKEQKEAAQVTIPLSRLIERVLQATGLGSASVKRILKESRIEPDGGKFSSPKKTINKNSPRSTLNQYEEQTVRTIIYRFANYHKKRPTMQAVFEAVKNKGIIYLGGWCIK